jgi:hypothetical protein
MKKLSLTVIGLYLLMLHAFSQDAAGDSSGYRSKPLKVDEINLVSSYYSQNGDHSPVTGGIGTEKVTDLSNGLELKFVGWDAGQRKHTLTAGLGFDHHTSASAAYVSKTGASHTGGSRVYPSLNWSVENDKKGTEFGAGVYYSSEYNYQSVGLDASFSKKTNNNGEFTAKVTSYFDQVKLIYPSELDPAAPAGGTGGREEKRKRPSSPRDTYSASLSFSQVINTRLQGCILLDAVVQNGYLGLPFHRVYFTDGSDHVEALPSNRFKLPVGFRLNYFLGDRIIIRSYYRFYTDDWGLTAHTASIEVPVKINPFFSISPFYRYYTQTAVKYFAPYGQHTAQDQYYTSNYALSAFTSNYFGAGIRLAPPGGIGGTHLNSLEIRYGHYTQSTDLLSNIISFEFKFK